MELEWGSWGGTEPKNSLKYTHNLFFSILNDTNINITSIDGVGVEGPLVDKHDDHVDGHNYFWVVAYLQEDSIHTLVGLHKEV